MRRELRDGLILRSLSEGHESDRTGIGPFYMDVFGDSGHPAPEELDVWSKDMMSERHPSMTLDDLWVVVDPAQKDRIVSALVLIPQTWRYEEIEFGVGRIEIVATHKDFRSRGLIRALMDTAHERSAQLGHIVQGITGIPHYYRRFGYAFAVDLGGRSAVNLDAIGELKEDQEPKYTLRPATDADVPQLVAWDRYYADECLLSHVRTEAMWRYELHYRSPDAPFYIHLHVIVSADGEDVGYIAWTAHPSRNFMGVMSYIVGEKASYVDTFEDVMCGIRAFTERFYAQRPENKPTRIMFDGGVTSTMDTLIERTPSGVARETIYAWYIRVEDIAGFIRKIAPVLERRLVRSGANRFTGTIKIGFYDLTGLTMLFENGCIKDVTHGELFQNDADAAFPYHYFLNVVFGHRTVKELNHILPECYADRTAAVVLGALFPKKRSWLMAMA